LLAQAQQARAAGDSRLAVELATRSLEQDPRLAEAYYLRGCDQFRLGQVGLSATDFDRYLELRPDQRSRLWERGISCYYAGRFQDGADQFVAYQQFDNRDVENVVWHVLCLSRILGLKEARKQLMPADGDPRIPMAAIHRLFAGKASVEDVLSEVKQRPLDDAARRTANFYAHLYIGLYHEAAGNEQQARQFITAAADQYSDANYMGDVARVHAARWRP
jgi:lipoprotein NlpI